MATSGLFESTLGASQMATSRLTSTRVSRFVARFAYIRPDHWQSSHETPIRHEAQCDVLLIRFLHPHTHGQRTVYLFLGGFLSDMEDPEVQLCRLDIEVRPLSRPSAPRAPPTSASERAANRSLTRNTPAGGMHTADSRTPAILRRCRCSRTFSDGRTAKESTY
jgi:hypothetical protein